MPKTEEPVVKETPLEGHEPEGGEGEGEGDPTPELKDGDLKAALHAERGRRKDLAKKLKEQDTALAEMKPLVEEYKQLLPHLPAILAAAKKGQEGEKPKAPEADAELIELANDMGFVDANGDPDVGRAAKLQARIDKRAGVVAAKTTEGVSRQAAGAVAAQLREKAYGAVDEDGQPYAKKEYIDKVLEGLTPAQQADPQQVTAALVMARGLGGPGVGPEEPLHVDGGGRAPRKTQTVLSDMDRNIARLRGKSEKDWGKLMDDDPATSGWELEG